MVGFSLFVIFLVPGRERHHCIYRVVIGTFLFFFSMILLPYLQVDQIPGNSRLTPALYVVAYTFTSSWAGGEEPREWGLLRSDDVFRWSAVEHVLVSHEHSCSAG
jgi:hypothetical protein